MCGRPKTLYVSLYRPICLEVEDGVDIELMEIPVLCPICHSALVGKYGYQESKTGLVEKFQCKNSTCPFRVSHRSGKQFNFRTSACFRDALQTQLSQIIKPLIMGDLSKKALGTQFHRSPALMTYLRRKVEKALKKMDILDQLVMECTLDNAVAMDETFLKIAGIPYYLILATGYQTRKILGLSISKTRDESALRQVFDEADKNTVFPIECLSVDAWGASQALAKHLNRPITLIIHKHKRPYDKAVIWDIQYVGDQRIIHKIGVKTDFFRKRKKREYRYLREQENTAPKILKKRGRPKGVKNGQGKPKNKPKAKKKRGRKGIFSVFTRGVKCYAKISPWRQKVRLAKSGSGTVGAALNRVIRLYSKMTIQNNLAENKNSMLEHRVWFSGRKTPESFEERLRTFVIMQNNPCLWVKLKISHAFRSDLLEKQLDRSVFGGMVREMYQWDNNLKKGGVLN